MKMSVLMLPVCAALILAGCADGPRHHMGGPDEGAGIMVKQVVHLKSRLQQAWDLRWEVRRASIQ